MKLTSGRTIALIIVVAMPSFWYQTEAAEPVYSDQDLERYNRRQVQLPVSRGTGEEGSRNARRPKGSDEILAGNLNAVAAVVAYDEKGTSFSHGSGFVIASNGAVVTSHHVISNAASVRVKVNNAILPVEGILYVDRDHDMVVLKVSGPALQTMTPGDSREVRQGDRVFLMDNPSGSRVKIAEGTVNGFREIGGRQVLQITIPLAAGSSGGAIVDQYGEVIGIATSTITDSTVNFATPWHTVQDRISLDRVITIREAFYRDAGGSAGYWISLGDGHNAALRYRDAIEAYKKAIAADPGSVEAFNGLGVAYTNLNMSSDALAALRKALSLDPQSAWIRSNLGMAYLEAKMYKEAADQLIVAVRIMPELAVAHFNLGIAYAKLGQYTSAIKAYREAIRLKPSFADAHYGLGLIYSQVNDRGAALEEYKILQGLDPALAKKLREKIGQ